MTLYETNKEVQAKITQLAIAKEIPECEVLERAMMLYWEAYKRGLKGETLLFDNHKGGENQYTEVKL